MGVAGKLGETGNNEKATSDKHPLAFALALCLYIFCLFCHLGTCQGSYSIYQARRESKLLFDVL